MIKENPDKGKYKEITEALEESASHLLLNLRKIKKMQDGIQQIQEGILSLTTRPPKIIKANNLALLYVKGMQNQNIKAKNSLCKIGIKRYTIRINFILLENFNPATAADPSIANDDYILRYEGACLKRISDIIERDKSPEYIKEFYKNEIRKIKFTKIPALISSSNNNSEMPIETISASELRIRTLANSLLSCSNPKNNSLPNNNSKNPNTSNPTSKTNIASSSQPNILS
eukprot:jgi/Orpsp1_1/1191144/evm.model.d7180000083782.1